MHFISEWEFFDFCKWKPLQKILSGISEIRLEISNVIYNEPLSAKFKHFTKISNNIQQKQIV